MSNASLDLFPDNTLTTFINKLPSALEAASDRVFELHVNSIRHDQDYQCLNTPKIPHLWIHPVSILKIINGPDGIGKQNLLNREWKRGFHVYFPTDIANDRDLINFITSVLTERWRKEIDLLENKGREKGIIFNTRQVVIFIEEHTSAHILHVIPPPEEDPRRKLIPIKNNRYWCMLPNDDFLVTIDFEIKRPKQVTVEIGELENRAHGGKSAATYLVDKANWKGYYEQKRESFFQISARRLTEISVRLVDENKQPLKLGFGQPTVMSLFIRSVPVGQNSIKQYLNITSNESILHYPENNANDFRVRAHPTLNFGNEPHNWNVCLKSIIIPGAFNPLPIKKCYVKANYVNINDARYAHSDGGNFNPPTELTIDSLITILQILLNDTEITINETGHLSLLYVGSAELVPTYIMPFELAAIMGYRELMNHAQHSTEEECVYIDAQYEQPLIFPAAIDVDLWIPKTIMLYSNLIDECPVGGNMLPLLYALFIRKDKMSAPRIQIEPVHLEWKTPKLTNGLYEMHFWMKTEDGRNVPFLNKNDEVQIELWFVK